MKLVSATLNGYRRFANASRLQLDCKLVALVGPNEAGKTSILRALQMLNSAAPLKSEGPSQDTTRGKSFPTEHRIVTAKFILNDVERAAIAHIKESQEIRWIFVDKQVDGRLVIRCFPKVLRDVTHRPFIFSKIASYMSYLKGSYLSENSPKLLNILSSLVQNLPVDGDMGKDTLASLREVASLLVNTGDDHSTKLSEEISEAIAIESKESPGVAMSKILRKFIPRFVLFDETARDLSSSYDLNTFFAESERSSVPPALSNLAQAASLNLEELWRAGMVNDAAKIESILERSNETLKLGMTEAWNQSKVYVRFRLNHPILNIFVGGSRGQFESISERSDGLRRFVALFSLLSTTIKAETEEVILLIDEVETHLHYDAQSDLMQMLSGQRLASKVIYSTHSMGCLPEDLGGGLRLVKAIGEAESTITNRFWADGDTGFSPLLFGMGAATMAFVPLRRCVLVEGPTDMLLLPTAIITLTKHTLVWYVAKDRPAMLRLR